MFDGGSSPLGNYMEIVTFSVSLEGERNIWTTKKHEGGLACKWDRLLLKKLAHCEPVKKAEKTQGITHTLTAWSCLQLPISFLVFQKLDC